MQFLSSLQMVILRVTAAIIKGWAKAEALGEGKTNDSGDVDIYIGGDVTITVDKDNIHWNGNDSLNYDISVKKSNTNNNNIGIDEMVIIMLSLLWMCPLQKVHLMISKSQMNLTAMV